MRIITHPFALECFGLFIFSQLLGMPASQDVWCFYVRSHGGGSWTRTAGSTPLLRQPPITCPPRLLLHILSECLEQWRRPVWLQSKVSPGSSNPFKVIWHDFMEVSLGENSNVKHNLVLESWKKKISDFFSSAFPLHILSGLPPSLSGVITSQWGPEVEATVAGGDLLTLPLPESSTAIQSHSLTQASLLTPFSGCCQGRML